MPGNVNSTKASGYNWQDLVLIHRADKPGLSIAINDHVVTLRKSKGSDYLYEVLSHPNQYISALQLGFLYANTRSAQSLSLGQDIREQGLSFDLFNSPEPSMDTQGINEIKKRLVWLNERCAELISWNDTAVLEDLNSEREQLIQYLSTALYPDGRPRRLEEEQLRVVQTVNKSLRRVLEQICQQNQELGRELRKRLRLGRQIGFFPE